MLRHSNYLIKQSAHQLGGIHKIYKYPNGYGASVVCFEYSYGGDKGLWEVMPIQYTNDEDYILLHDEVRGHLNDAGVDSLLDEIAERGQ